MADDAGNHQSEDAELQGTAAAAPVAMLERALVLYEHNRSPATLDQAFGAAAAAVAAVRGRRAAKPADAIEIRQLMEELPDFERLVSIAVSETEQAAHAGASRLWEWFGLSSVPPGWNDDERSGARIVVASACAPLHARGAAWLRPRLLKLAADRWAGLLTAELQTADEELWRRSLGERYESVRQRYALRSKRRSGQLSKLLEVDDAPLVALRKRLARWLVDSGDLDELPVEIEAAFVHSRTPARLA